jgi:S-adenosylmethionine:tRNA ribosyltransferase-isomerase
MTVGPASPPAAPAGGGLDFVLPADLSAAEPPEARAGRRDAVRLLVGRRGTGEVSHHRFDELAGLLRPGDVLVVNTSATLPAAVPAGAGRQLHLSTALPDGTWAVEVRHGRGAATEPVFDAVPGTALPLPGGVTARLLGRYSGRLWRARLERDGAAGGAPDGPAGLDVPAYLRGHGKPIRYSYVPREWPLEAYQTVFATVPGSAEMPSAGRPFSTELVTLLVSAGVLVVPVVLHTGVASPEAHEKPYPERYEVPAATARVVTQARRAGSRVVAVGTTVVRALESAARPDGTVTGRAGGTSLVVTPGRGTWAVDGLLTGFHEPRASHLELLAAVAGADLLARCYREALAHRYRWHEFGDLNLLLP